MKQTYLALATLLIGCSVGCAPRGSGSGGRTVTLTSATTTTPTRGTQITGTRFDPQVMKLAWDGVLAIEQRNAIRCRSADDSRACHANLYTDADQALCALSSQEDCRETIIRATADKAATAHNQRLQVVVLRERVEVIGDVTVLLEMLGSIDTPEEAWLWAQANAQAVWPEIEAREIAIGTELKQPGPWTPGACKGIVVQHDGTLRTECGGSTMDSCRYFPDIPTWAQNALKFAAPKGVVCKTEDGGWRATRSIGGTTCSCMHTVYRDGRNQSQCSPCQPAPRDLPVAPSEPVAPAIPAEPAKR